MLTEPIAVTLLVVEALECDTYLRYSVLDYVPSF